MLFSWTFYSSSILKKKFPSKHKAALFSALIIRNVSRTANQHIRIISERSCDTENCVLDLKRRRAEGSVYDITLREQTDPMLLNHLTVLWCQTLIILLGAASSPTHLLSAGNSVLHHWNKLHLKKIYSNRKRCNYISQYYCFHCISEQINAALVNVRDYQTQM